MEDREVYENKIIKLELSNTELKKRIELMDCRPQLEKLSKNAEEISKAFTELQKENKHNLGLNISYCEMIKLLEQKIVILEDTVEFKNQEIDRMSFIIENRDKLKWQNQKD